MAMSPLFHTALVLTAAEGVSTRQQMATSHQTSGGIHINAAYTFDDFVLDFGRTYEAGSEEYAGRAALFQDSLTQIHEWNSRTGRSWTAGVYPFMDWTAAERMARLHGYRPSVSRRSAASSPPSALQTDASRTASRLYGGVEDSFEAQAPPVRNQGICGSCWAVAAAEAVEAQLLKGISPGQVSVQALLDCVPNPRHCGGSGGCGGANPDQAFDFMRDHGVPLEDDLPYSPRQTGKCPLDPYPSNWARITLTGWQALPRNQAQPVMQAIVNDGPVVVTVAANDWYPYDSGIFDGCPKDTVPNHSVLARGYGAEGGKRYWLLQNSWGSRWGEQGSIRLLRHEDEDGWCGIDSRPQEGFACEDEANQNVTVCGNCGILSDAVVPQVGGVSVDVGQFGYGSGPASSTAAPASPRSDRSPEGVRRMPTVVQPDVLGNGNSAHAALDTPAHEAPATVAARDRLQPQKAEEGKPEAELTFGETPMEGYLASEDMYLPGHSPMDGYLRR